MKEFVVSCDGCGNQITFKYPTRATLACSSCGGRVGHISFPEGEEDNAIILGCSKCTNQFPVRTGISALLQCPLFKCAWPILETVRTLTLSKLISLSEEKESEILISNPRIAPPPPMRGHKIPVRITIPYYHGGPRIKRAIESWICSEVVFVLTDEGVIPPGYGVCSQLFTEKNAKVEGLGKKTKPYLIDVLSQMLKMFPNEEYYGYFNSDVILPLGVPIRSLLPNDGKKIVFHHRKEFEGEPETPINKLTERYQTYCGKDGFICDKATAIEIVNEVEDLILGAATWDNGLAVWAIKRYGLDRVDLRYGEIWHQLHKQEWGYDDKETIFNRDQWKKMGLDDPIRNAVDWYRVSTMHSDPPLSLKKLGIIQPGRIGDIIIVLPIAKWYYDLGYKIVWPVPSEYMNLFEYVNYVSAIDIGRGLQGAYIKSKNALDKEGLDFEIDLGIGFGLDESNWKKSGLSFDEWKYKEAGVPFEERFNLFIHRKHQTELDLEQKLKLEERTSFSLTHSVGSKGSVAFGIPDSIEIKPIQGFTVFDWIGLIERCTQIYCVDSCVAHLVNQMGLAKGRRHFRPLSDYHGRPRKMAIPQIDWKQEEKESFDRLVLDKSSRGNGSGFVDKDREKEIPPIHFFTIVLNGMPFIEYHIDVLKELPYNWHWHIIEGVADLNHDTQWSKLLGGRVDSIFHKNGLSNDGTTEYLNQLARSFPNNVSLYRKRDGKFWDGKVDMVNAPINSLPNYCLLWEIDADEFWDGENISKMVEMFQNNPEKMAAIVPSHFFVGPRRFVTSQDTWATKHDDSFRVFRFFKGMYWKKHEPPTLVDKNGKDWGRCYTISRKDVLKAGIFFQHFAYVIPEQLKFKEIYYGYTNATKFWNILQNSNDTKIDPSKYLPWARPGAIAEIWDESIHGSLLFNNEKFIKPKIIKRFIEKESVI